MSLSAYGGWLAYKPEDVRPGYGALLLVLGLAVVTYLLWRSMNTQLGKIQMPPSQQSRQSRQSPSQPPGQPDPGSDVDEGDGDAERPPAPPGN